MNILFYLWEVFIFVLLTGWLVLLPGLYLTGFLRIPLTRIEKLSVSLAAGICGLTLLLYIFGSLNARFLVYVIVSLVSLFWLARQSKPWRRRIQNFAWLPLNKNNIFSVFLIISGALASGSILFRSGWQNVGGSLSFTEYRDAFWHLGLMEELVRQIPPLHPGFAPLPLTNYHYFAHLFGASYLFLGVFNNLDFYFRLFPFLLTLLFGLSLYIAGRALTKSVFGANLAVIFGYFTGSFAYVLPLFIRYPGFDWHESSFWLSQPFSMAINPSFALSSFLFLATVFLLTKMSVSPKKELAILITLIGGTLIIYKVYAGALFLGGLLVCSLWDLLKSHKPILIMTFIFSS
ncbi:MAG: hypothetical protein M1120_02840, partial [Patescibacteria group bacterium]|nr:hypothetical protein [Patescibacteria group bacterium]